VGGNALHSEIHKFTYSVRNKKELPQPWKESLNVSFHKKGDTIDCSTLEGYQLPTMYKILSNILVSKLTPYVGKIIGDLRCGF
jgi:hypothetical protein